MIALLDNDNAGVFIPLVHILDNPSQLFRTFSHPLWTPSGECGYQNWTRIVTWRELHMGG
jgi:hypothetical protein